MRFISKILVAGLLSSFAILPAQAETVKITLLGVGDIYKFEGGKTRGGLARLNAVARAERAANPNTLYLFDGDMLSPSLLSGFDKGAEHDRAHQSRALRPRGAGQPRI